MSVWFGPHRMYCIYSQIEGRFYCKLIIRINVCHIALCIGSDQSVSLGLYAKEKLANETQVN